MKPRTCPRCGSGDLYRRSLTRTATPSAWCICFVCSCTFHRRGQWVVDLETTEERRARRLRAEAAQAAERPRHV